MEKMNADDSIYDWNLVSTVRPLAKNGRVILYDETLRDGIQSPSAVDPPIEDKIQLIHLMNDLGIDYADIGLPGAGPRAVEDVSRLAQEMVDTGMPMKASCAARTHINDIRPIVEISQSVGIEIEVMAFLGSSPIRQYAENWDDDRLLQLSGDAIEFAASNNLPVSFVTEDTVRSRPGTLDKLFKNAIEKGARRLCLCDTVGHATPDGVRSLVEFSQGVIDAVGMSGKVGLDWHGHNDRGLALTNAIRALEAGADRIHGTALGIGERVGNTAMDQLLLNLKLLGEIDNDLTQLLVYCQVASEAIRWPIAQNYPLAGSDAFRTATGVHAAAIIKAENKGDDWLADRIYSGVPASMFGKRQEIEIGHMSGASNVQYWLMTRHIEPAPDLVENILGRAKSTNRTLTEDEVMAAVRKFQADH